MQSSFDLATLAFDDDKSLLKCSLSIPEDLFDFLGEAYVPDEGDMFLKENGLLDVAGAALGADGPSTSVSLFATTTHKLQHLTKLRYSNIRVHASSVVWVKVAIVVSNSVWRGCYNASMLNLRNLDTSRSSRDIDQPPIS